jgi:peptidoglycan/LPS O-acetylase OafA/YrhL
MSKAANRIPSLDGIRAVSIALVLVSHFGRDAELQDPLDLGLLGVRIFFVISGYLITGLLLKEMQEDGRVNLLRFYFRRTMRIFPAFYFYLGCMLLVSVLGWGGLSFRQALPALTYTSNYFPAPQMLIRHTWSLATEEQFYLIWPAVLAVFKPRHGVLALLSLLIIAPLSSHFLSREFGHAVPAFFNSAIGIGCLLALTHKSLHHTQLYRRWINSQLGLLLPMVLLISGLPALHIGGLRDSLFSLIQNLAIALSLDWTVVHCDRSVGRLLNLPTVVYIGVLSYSLYLWQQPFSSLYGEGSNLTLYLSGHWRLLANPVARVAALSLCTLLSYYLVERPMLRLRVRLELKWFASEMSSPKLPGHPELAEDTLGGKVG